MSIFDDYLTTYKAGECLPSLRRMLKNGGTAHWFDGKRTRVICHNAVLHRPMTRLPWPFSIIQPHLISLQIFEGDTHSKQMAISDADPVYWHNYKKSEMNVAIEVFLQGAQPDERIVIIESRNYGTF